MAIERRWSPPSSPRGLELDIVQKAASFTADANLSECVVQATAGLTVTLPNNLPVGFSFMVEQGSSGAVVFAAASGATLVNRQTHDSTAGQYAVATVYVRSNVQNRTAEWLLAGDTAAAA